MKTKRRMGLRTPTLACEADELARAELAALALLQGHRAFWLARRGAVFYRPHRLGPVRVDVDPATVGVWPLGGLGVRQNGGPHMWLYHLWPAYTEHTDDRDPPLGKRRRGLRGRLTAAKLDRMARQEAAVVGLLRAGDGGCWLRLTGGVAMRVVDLDVTMLDEDEGIRVLACRPEDADARWVALGDVEAVGEPELPDACPLCGVDADGCYCAYEAEPMD